MAPVQKRRLFSHLRSSMLRQLISCNGCESMVDLCAVLRAEVSSGVPAQAPSWYKFSTVTMGPRKIGFDSCSSRGCFLTEDADAKFQRCSGCGVVVYCSKGCQKADWKARHKHVCKDAGSRAQSAQTASQVLEMLSSTSL
eukprot:TRINITY_DN24264_c0_g1_i1.p1 TRINITY_DN24264_c0_g1~~TRINITY_DN24264_c0_g1_i1.p1  ORF type:complete len:140 (+),score=19.94 TRINITY_DN24264_c0_g1_i1:360-779(+)